MFQKKPSAPKAPWTVRVLTADFLVDGFADTEAHPESWAFFTTAVGSTPTGLLWLDGPKFTPVIAGVAAPPAVRQWVLPFTGDFTALMPFDDACLAAVRKNIASLKEPHAALVHAGPFALRGQLLSEYGAVSYLSTMSGHLSLAMQDVEIEYLRPNPGFSGLKAPLVLLHTRALQGIGLLG